MQIGDGLNYSNASLILLTCDSEGTLLQPSRPATAIDKCFAYDAGVNTTAAPVPARDHNYPVMSTHTLVSGKVWSHVLTVLLNNSYEVLMRLYECMYE